jgi:hypothetical protein
MADINSVAKTNFNYLISLKVKSLPGALPETLQGDILYFALTNTNLKLAKQIILRRWAVRETRKRHQENPEKNADVDPESEEKVNKANEEDFRKCVALRRALCEFYSLYLDDNTIVMNEYADDLDSIIDSGVVVNIQREEEIYAAMEEERRRYTEILQKQQQSSASLEDPSTQDEQEVGDEEKENIDLNIENENQVQELDS